MQFSGCRCGRFNLYLKLGSLSRRYTTILFTGNDKLIVEEIQLEEKVKQKSTFGEYVYFVISDFLLLVFSAFSQKLGKYNYKCNQTPIRKKNKGRQVVHKLTSSRWKNKNKFISYRSFSLETKQFKSCDGHSL